METLQSPIEKEFEESHKHFTDDQSDFMVEQIRRRMLPLDRLDFKNDPIVIALTDGATVSLNASKGDVFTLSAVGNRTIGVPQGAINGKRILIVHHADNAARTLTLTTGSAGAFIYGATITGLTETGTEKRDVIEAVYNKAMDRWLVIDYVKGYRTGEVTDAHGLTLNTTTGTTAQGGFKIEPNVACLLLTITKDSNCTATRARLLDSSKVELATASFSGNAADFSYQMSAVTTYYVVADASGGAYNHVRNGTATSFPITDINIDWTGGLNEDVDDTTRGANVESVTTLQN